MSSINNKLKTFRDENGSEIYVVNNKNIFLDKKRAEEFLLEQDFYDFYQLNILTMYDDDDERIDAGCIDVFNWIITNKEFLTNFLTGL